MFENSFIKEAIEQANGRLIPIIIPYEQMKNSGVGIMNPSVYNDNGKIKVIARCVNYFFICSEEFPAFDGPIQYLHPENEFALKTNNFIVEFSNDLNSIVSIKPINMMNLHTSQWEMHGLEDARLFRWNNHLYGCGCRRDYDDTGKCRMELCEFIEQDDCYKEVSRDRMLMPNGDEEYAEKNWMPILDNPYHWLRWINPSQIIYYDIESKETHIDNLYEKEYKYWHRGGTQLVRYKDYYISFGHTVSLTKPYAGNKSSYYNTTIAIYDKDLNLLVDTEDFYLSDVEVEFVCGLALNNDKLILSWGYNDNMAYLFEFDVDWLLNKLLN